MRIIEIDRECNKHVELPERCRCKCIALYFAEGESEPLYVSEEIFFKYGLYDCEQLTEEEYNQYDYLFRVECAKHSATSFLFCKKYTSYEVAKKLLKQGHREDIVNEVVLYYEKMEYIDDERYLDVYIDGVIKNKIMSLNSLCAKLSEKGFTRERVISVAEERGFDEYDMAEKAMNRKTGNRKVEDYKEKMKLMRYLAGKGFGGEVISSIFREDY